MNLQRAVAATPVWHIHHRQLGRVFSAVPPVAALTIFLMGAVYCLVVPGRPRTYAKIAVAVVIALFCLARVYLAVDLRPAPPRPAGGLRWAYLGEPASGLGAGGAAVST